MQEAVNQTGAANQTGAERFTTQFKKLDKIRNKLDKH
jgi:hypothetical protein